MQDFRTKAPQMEGNTAIFGAIGREYRVLLTVERLDKKNVTETEARRIYTEAMTAFPKVKSVGRVSD